MGYHQIPNADIQEEIISSTIQQEESHSEEQIKTKQETKSKSKEKPKFGSPPDFDSPNFDFKKELERLPFPVNLGEVNMSFEQQK